MPKRKMSDIVLHRISPPDYQKELSIEDLSHVMVRRLGLKRKESRADHARLLLELIKYRRDNIPIGIEKISEMLSVSQSQSYEEIRKWRTLGLIEFVKIPGQSGFVKGYMLPQATTNRLLDRVESSLKSFMRKTRRIAKDFDDLLMLEMARSSKIGEKEAIEQANAAVSKKRPDSDTVDESTSVMENDEEYSGTGEKEEKISRKK